MEGNSSTVDLQIQRPAFDSFVGATHIPAAPTMSFVGAATVLEPEHATVGAAPMPAAPKKSPIATNCFSCSVRRCSSWTEKPAVASAGAKP